MEGREEASGAGWGVLAAGAAVLAVCATAACGYRFGVADQAQYLARAAQVWSGGGLRGDPYLRAFGAIRAVAWDGVAMVCGEGWAPVAALAVTLGCAFTGALALAWAMRGLARGAGALLPAAALVVPKEQNWFGLVSLSDLELTPMLMAMPLALWSMAAFVRGRVWWSLALAAAAVPVHGQIGAYLLCAWWAGTALSSPRRGALGAALCVTAGVGAAALTWSVLEARVAPEHLDAYERVGLELFPALINPTRASWTAWGACLALLGVGAVSWIGVRRAAGPGRADVDRLGVYALGSLALPVAGIAAVALGVREPFVWTLMVGRGLMVSQIAAVVAASAWAVRRSDRVGVVLGVGLVAWGVPGQAMAAGAVGMALVALAAAAPSGRGDRSWARAASVCAFVGAVAAGVIGAAAHGMAWTRDAADPDWRGVQRWARDHTEPGAGFVTPPYLAGWRVGSWRPTYGELRDGGLLFYAGEPALAWRGRMATLGMDDVSAAWDDGGGRPDLAVAYAAALEGAGVDAVRRAGIGFVVCERRRPVRVGRVVWANEGFEVRTLGGEGGVVLAPEAGR